MTTDEALRALLRERVRICGVTLAKKLGISQPYLIAVINGDRKAGKAVGAVRGAPAAGGAVATSSAPGAAAAETPG